VSRQSEKVKDWRKRTKERIIVSMGGKCVICGYNRCSASLALHHLNPSEKDFSFGALRASIRGWATIVHELRKCILVCNNCHGEIHSGLIAVPHNVISFNEEYATYSLFQPKQDTYCPVCGQIKSFHTITCSPQCSAKRRSKIDWSKVDFATVLQSKSVVKLAEELGCSDAAVHKRLRKLGLK
jgi:hypothetical protein